MWDDRPIIILGAGPSLTRGTINRLHGLGYILAVKSLAFEVEFADAGFGIDKPRFKEWRAALGALPFPVYWGVPDDFKIEDIPDNVTLLKRSRENYFTDDETLFPCGGTSGLGALAFAIRKIGLETKGRTIFLFGFDYKPLDHIWHSFPQHYGMVRIQRAENWASWAERFEPIVTYAKDKGIRVINVNDESMIKCTEKIGTEDAIIELERLQNGYEKEFDLDRVRSA